MNEPATTDAEDRFNSYPRPLHFIRVRLYRGGQAEYIQEVLEDTRDDLYEDLARLRDRNMPESHPEIEEVKEHLRYVINALKDVSSGIIELVGSDKFAAER